MTLPSTRTLIIAGVALVVVAMAAVGGWFWWDAQQRRVLAATAEVMARAQPAFAPDATTEVKLAAARDLEQLLQRYPSARTVPTSAYELGNLRYAAGQYPGARAAYELSLQRGATGLVSAMARAGVARTWEAERDFARAADGYAALVKQLDPRSFMYEDALIDQGRSLELAWQEGGGDRDLRALLKDVPTAKRSDDVRSRLASLGAAAR